jgi:hypothetical protein
MTYFSSATSRRTVSKSCAIANPLIKDGDLEDRSVRIVGGVHGSTFIVIHGWELSIARAADMVRANFSSPNLQAPTLPVIRKIPFVWMLPFLLVNRP